MSVESYSAFLEATGHKVLRDNNACWYDSGMRFMISFPFDAVLDAPEVARSSSLAAYARGARFLCREGQGRASWTISCDDRNYDLANLSANTRSKIRRGLEHYWIGEIAVEQLQTSGMRLNIETQLRQGRKVDAGFERYWRGYFAALSKAPDVHLWGAINASGLGAYCVAFPMGDVAHLLILRSGDSHLKSYVNNALIYTYLRHVLVELGMRSVSFGWEPIQRELPGLIDFKQSMGFKRQPANQAIVTTKAISRLLISPVGRLLQAFPEEIYASERANKLKGLANWVRQSPAIVFKRDS